GHRVELPCRNRVVVVPGRSLVVADVDAAVIANHQVIAVVRVDPNGVVVAVRDALDDRKGLSAISGLKKGRSSGIHDLIALRIDPYLAVIHRPIIIVADQLPGLAFTVRAPDAAPFWIWRPVSLLARRPRLTWLGLGTRLALGARLALRSCLPLWS